MKTGYDQFLGQLPMLFAALFVGATFVQSGFDKVFNYRGQLSWLQGHFSKTFLAGMVPMMLATITVMEVATGLIAVAGVVYYLATGTQTLIFFSSIAGAATILALFIGQRVAQDYPGAAILVPYFIVQLVLMYLSRPL